MAVGAGALTVKYYNGTDFVDLEGFVDGTAVGGNTFAADGIISFVAPADWVTRDDVSPGNDGYYIELGPTTVPSTAPAAARGWP